MRSLVLILALAAALAACSHPMEKAPPPPRVENDTVVFDPSSPQPAFLRTANAEPRRETVLRFNGRLVWNEDRTARVFTPYGGRVLSIAVTPGDRVKIGQELAVLASPELGGAQADARKAEQDYVLAQKNRARVEELHAAGVAPEKELHAAQAEAARAASERMRTLARLKIYGNAVGEVDPRFVLRSPVSGVIVERQLNPGQELRPEAAPQGGLFVVSDPERLWFVLDVPEAALGLVRPGLEVELSTSSLGDERVAGRVDHVSDSVDTQTRSVKVRGALDNKDRRLKAEMFITAALKIPAAKGLVVPTRAVYLRGDQYFVFCDAGAGRYVRKAVHIGPSNNGQQVLLDGIDAGAKVVVEGNLQLDKILAAKE